MKDRNGDFRMECSQCSCKEYVVEEGSVKYSFCGHFPVSHAVADFSQNPGNSILPSFSGFVSTTSSLTIDGKETPLSPTSSNEESNLKQKQNENEIENEIEIENLLPSTSSTKSKSAKMKRLENFLRDLFSKEDGEPYTAENENEVLCNVCNTKVNLGET